MTTQSPHAERWDASYGCRPGWRPREGSARGCHVEDRLAAHPTLAHGFDRVRDPLPRSAPAELHLDHADVYQVDERLQVRARVTERQVRAPGLRRPDCRVGRQDRRFDAWREANAGDDRGPQDTGGEGPSKPIRPDQANSVAIASPLMTSRDKVRQTRPDCYEIVVARLRKS